MSNNQYLSDYRLENGILQPNILPNSVPKGASMNDRVIEILKKPLGMRGIYYPEERMIWNGTGGEVTKFIHTAMQQVNFIIEYGDPLVPDTYWKTRNFRNCIFDFLSIG
jgi:hypothetical protein